jgi:hypothetical protein
MKFAHVKTVFVPEKMGYQGFMLSQGFGPRHPKGGIKTKGDRQKKETTGPWA